MNLNGFTTAGGAFFDSRVKEPLIVGLIAVGVVTSTQAIPTTALLQVASPRQQTNSGVPVALPQPASRVIAEIRRLSGLSWEQLAHLCNVSRRALHFWASGSRMTNQNRAHLDRLLDAFRFIDRGSSTENRMAILAAKDDGTSLFDYLAAGNYDAVKAALGRGRSRHPGVFADDSRTYTPDRRPRPPEELVDAFQDRVHVQSGQVRAGKSVRTRSGA